ncbi:MAG: hypothetical protein WC356_02270 [Candidatus Micrarchaeia archaeon]|jgi:hypothetical protein
MGFDRLESAKFAIAADEIMDKLTGGVEKALAENAGRGFAMPGGDTLAAILAATQDAKGKLVEVNGKIYEERRGVIFQEQEFELKYMVQIAKLAMDLYKEELMNALAIEAAQADALRDTGRADVARMNSETEKRTVAIMQNRAEAERRITIHKQDLVDAENRTLPAEAALVQAQLSTAEKKLEIIDSIYAVLAAEQLVLAAEQRRADSLSKVLAAEQIVATIKREMIPFYIQKADARLDLAAAITAEIPIREAIEMLGYDRITLKNSEEVANHLTRAAENELETARQKYSQAERATSLARAQSQRVLQEYSNSVRDSILTKKQGLEQDGIDLKLDTSLARHAIDVNANIATTGEEISNLTEELSAILANIVLKTNAHVLAIQASANTTEYISSQGTHFTWDTII